ncbi:MAG: ABC transporter ATP-binding protein [Bacteroidales bacterium]
MSIIIENLNFSYNKIPVLNNINKEIHKGEFVGLVGPNGSGKSTLIKCLLGILRPGGGKIKIDQEDITKLNRTALARKIGYVPQERSTLPNTTVYDTILLGRKPHIKWKVTQYDKNIVTDIISKLNLQSIAMKSVNSLSGGERQKVFIARALAQEPEILLLDEPTANLDINHQMEVMQLLTRISKKDYTIIAALHDINLAAQFCTHFIMLKAGNLFAFGGNEVLEKNTIEKLYEVKIDMAKNNGKSFFIPVSEDS